MAGNLQGAYSERPQVAAAPEREREVLRDAEGGEEREVLEHHEVRVRGRVINEK